MGFFAWLVIIIPLIFIFYMAFYVKRYICGAADYLVGGRVAGPRFDRETHTRTSGSGEKC